MASCDSIREFCDQLDTVCTSLERLFKLAGSEHEDIELAALPTMLRFRELLDVGDVLCGQSER